MAKRVSELPAASAVADGDELELNQAGASRKATRAQLIAGLVATAANVGAGGVGALAGRIDAELQFRHIAAASDKVSIDLNGEDIEIDVVEDNLVVPSTSIAGLATVATTGELGALSSLDAEGGALTNFRAAQDTVSGDYTLIATDSGREKIFTGTGPSTWTLPALAAGSQVVVHNIGSGAVSFTASGVLLKGQTTLAADRSASLSWLPGNIVKLTGELS